MLTDLLFYILIQYEPDIKVSSSPKAACSTELLLLSGKKVGPTLAPSICTCGLVQASFTHTVGKPLITQVTSTQEVPNVSRTGGSPRMQPKHMLPPHLPCSHTLRNCHMTCHLLLRTSPDILLRDTTPSWSCSSLVPSQATHGTGSSPSVMSYFNVQHSQQMGTLTPKPNSSPSFLNSHH